MSDRQDLLLAARLFDGRRLLRDRYVLRRDGRIAATGPAADMPPGQPIRRIGPDRIVAPGLVDLQVNGGGDVLLNDDPTPEGVARIVAAHRALGTAWLLPTLITDHRAVVTEAILAVREAIRRGTPGVLGIHLEGPFLNPRRPGIHDPARIATFTPADIDLLAGLGNAGVTMVTLAPECVPTGTVAALRRRGVLVMAGHTEATAEQVMAALDEGLSGFTHLFNAMPPPTGRAPGPAGAALATGRGFAGLIGDGRHIAMTMLRAALRARGPAGCFLVSDAMPTVGGIRPWFDIGPRRVTLVDGVPTGPDGTLGGAGIALAEAVSRVAAAGVPLPQALALATRHPARLVGRETVLGSIFPGSAGPLTVLDPLSGRAEIA